MAFLEGTSIREAFENRNWPGKRVRAPTGSAPPLNRRSAWQLMLSMVGQIR